MQTERSENRKKECATGEKSKVEQIISTVKQGFKNQTEILTNTVRGNNQTRVPIDQARNTPADQTERLHAQEMQRIRSLLHMQWMKNFPQIMQPINMHPMNQMDQPNRNNARPNPENNTR